MASRWQANDDQINLQTRYRWAVMILGQNLALTYWGLDKMAAILLTTFSWKKIIVF